MEEIQEVTGVMKGIAQAIPKTNRRIWTEEEIFAAMEKLDLKSTSLLDSVDWLVAHPSLIGTFFTCPKDLHME
ncbi:unnamed protein product [Dovyalis caffra]|uniref:Uncharacterized protein n=1 Tax=Dovyalis caffra TaxID=77055 RepID=A0AAV1RC99_9ROSI|nr:unnamed protein product [Dovyalis caffra]